MGYENVGKVWTPDELKEELSILGKPPWCRAVTLHNTGEPTLVQRPKGFSMASIANLHSYYEDTMLWHAGPHFFIDDHKIWGLSSYLAPGVHAVSFNRYAIGIEVLGMYDKEDPFTGRGLACWQLAAAATRILLAWLGLPANKDTVLFHRDDPKTTKTCPGTKVKKEWVLGLIAQG